MPHYVGLDASKATTSICVLDETGATVTEGVVETQPKSIVAFLRGERRRYRRVGLESMGMAPWLYEGLARAGLPIICIEARHAHGMLKGRLNKTDRNDARGIAEIMRGGLYKAVHIKTGEARRARLLLTTRRFLARKRRDFDNLIRGTLLQFGLKLEAGRPSTFERRAETLAAGSTATAGIVRALLRLRTGILREMAELDGGIAELVASDEVCQRFLTVPGVGPLTALTFKTAVDVPERFRRSRDVGVHLGLTPRTYRSGSIDRKGRISKCGDEATRSALFLSAKVILSRRNGASSLKSFGLGVVGRRGYLKGVVAVARRLAVVLHTMWVTRTDFRQAPLSN